MIEQRNDVAPAATMTTLNRRQALMAGAAAAVVQLAGGGVLGAGAAMAADGKRPNVLFILADDLGWKDVGFHGSDIKTPNLDRLAETGARLEQFYAQPMCTPTRAAFLTGRYPIRYGLQTAVIPSAGKYGLATDEWLLPQALKEAGYDTHLVGKWHLGHGSEEYFPSNRGFDHAYGPLIGEIDHFKHSSHGVMDWYRDGKPLEEEGYDTTLFGAEAVKVIEGHDTANPLFMYLAFTAPHSPYQAPKAYEDRFPEIADPQRRAYAGMISAMDEEIGNVVAALEKKGMREDTLIFFMSDNGGTRSAMFAGEAAVKGELPPNNGPYRDGKGTLYEGGTRVVAIANWPGHIKPGIVDGMMHIVDIFPTLASVAGAKLDKTKPLDGIDVWTTISEGNPSPRSEIVYNIEPYRAGVREGDMKLVWISLLPGRVELFDIASDPGEANNLADAHPETVAALQKRATALAAEAKPPLFITDMIRIGLSQKPAFPGGDLAGLGSYEE